MTIKSKTVDINVSNNARIYFWSSVEDDICRLISVRDLLNGQKTYRLLVRQGDVFRFVSRGPRKLGHDFTMHTEVNTEHYVGIGSNLDLIDLLPEEIDGIKGKFKILNPQITTTDSLYTKVMGLLTGAGVVAIAPSRENITLRLYDPASHKHISHRVVYHAAYEITDDASFKVTNPLVVKATDEDDASKSPADKEFFLIQDLNTSVIYLHFNKGEFPLQLLNSVSATITKEYPLLKAKWEKNQVVLTVNVDKGE